MQLDNLGQLAVNCPRYFGPPVGVTSPDEPDIIVTQDGNFQHRRYAYASVPIPGHVPQVPELFVAPQEVQDMADELTRISQGGHMGNNQLRDEIVSVEPTLKFLIFYLAHVDEYSCIASVH